MLKILSIILIVLLSASSMKTTLPDSKRASDVRNQVWPRLQKELKNQGFKSGSAVYLRVFKYQNVLEVWLKNGSNYKLFKSYEICYFSGGLGTKSRSGDGKSPEGYYAIEPRQLNPVSNYHLAMNIGYPNPIEQLKGYTGDAVMIHGHCASIGCYAMTDPRIDEIYTLVYKAFEGGQQKINLDIYPFRMSQNYMQLFSHQPYMPFWKTMKPGYDIFEKTHVPASYHIKDRDYAF